MCPAQAITACVDAELVVKTIVIPLSVFAAVDAQPVRSYALSVMLETPHPEKLPPACEPLKPHALVSVNVSEGIGKILSGAPEHAVKPFGAFVVLHGLAFATVALYVVR